MRTTTLAEVAAVLREASRILAFSHVTPDGDALGSLLGFGWLMQAPGRHVTLVSADGVPEEYQFLPGAVDVQTDAPAGPWDAVVALDASDPRRLGGPFRPDTYDNAPIIVIDHHITNTRFGTLNYVDATAAATAQILVGLADALPASISFEAAACLLTGLATDTLGFRTSNVTPRVMETAVRLMEAGANLSEIVSRTLAARPLNAMRLWGRALANLQHEGRVVWAAVSNEMREQAGASADGESGLVSFLVGAPEVDIAAVFSETAEGAVEISFRARPGFDVSGLALDLGGGGHPQAAGCTVDGPLAAAQARVVPMLVALAAGGPNRNG
jgi:phosphoesterase RecJ-like protein